MKRNRKIIFWSIPLIMFVLLLFLWQLKDEGDLGKTYVVHSGVLESVVESIGEVKGEKATEITIPESIRDRELRIWQIKIADMVPEGKIVKKGDYIAQLDQTEISNHMRDKIQEKEKADADLKNARIDSTVALTQKREEITNSLLDIEYNKIDLEQSVYESVAYQRKARTKFEKAELELEKKRRDYLLEKNKTKVKVQRLESKVKELDERISKYQNALGATRITTPQDGIVMLGKNWDGKKYSKDDNISMWQPLIATLPDMSSVISETYVKEIDIAKISVGDSVSITIDALPDNYFSGRIYKIASIGEDHIGFDMKVFKVIVRFDSSDEALRPGMTCINHIIVERFTNKPLLPLVAVYKDSLQSVVYRKYAGKVSKQPIIIGAENKGMVVVVSGLKEGDKVLLNPPAAEL